MSWVKEKKNTLNVNRDFCVFVVNFYNSKSQFEEGYFLNRDATKILE